MSEYAEQLISAREHEEGELLRRSFADLSVDTLRTAPPDPRRPLPSKKRPKPISPITPRDR